MSTTAQLVQLKPKPSQKPSIELVNEDARWSGTSSPHKEEEDVPCSVDDDEASNQTRTINDIESLKKGIVKTSKKHTIVLVGEPGVGKSSFLLFIANVLTGNDIDHYDFDILDHTNEKASINNNQAQTNEARLYEIMSTNGVVVRILDTPGLVNSVQHDKFHKESVATQIEDHIDSVTAILILANGTISRDTGGIGSALSTLSSIFPKTPTKNIALLFTNVWDPLCFNVCEDTIPSILQDAPQFQIDNPIALQRKSEVDPNMQEDGTRMELLKVMKAAEHGALERVTELFDWLEGLEPQEIPPMARPPTKEATIIRVPGPKQKLTTNYHKICTSVSNFYSTGPMRLHVICLLGAIFIPWIQVFLCSGLIPFSQRSQLFCG